MKRIIYLLIAMFSIIASNLSLNANVLASSLQSSASESQAQASTTNSFSMVAPSNCPQTGCAAGQRINFRASYILSSLSNNKPNIQVCIYIPDGKDSNENSVSWADSSSFSINLTGNSSQATYTSGETASVCTNHLPSNYTLLGAAYASLTTSTGSDSLDFVFRINSLTANSATSTNPLLVNVYQADSSGSSWSSSQSLPLAVTVDQASSPAYVAKDSSTCGSKSPCYLNSNDDLAGGIGTGLKDAIDAMPASSTIDILGTYLIKDNAVTIDKADTIQGLNNATLTTASGTCTNAMLLVTAGASLENLNITDGTCSNPSRDLISINSASKVLIEGNTLTSGGNAINIADNTGSVFVEFNQISSNNGYAILRSAGSSAGTLQAIANNIVNNGSDIQVSCNNAGQVDHNYWGDGHLPSQDSASCTASDDKRLGAPINLKNSSPGVDASEVTVTSSKTSLSSLGISYQHSASDSDFNIFIVNHGHGDTSNIPFYPDHTGYLITCGNFLDIFLSQDTQGTPSELDLYFKYDLNATCITNIESSQYCSQTVDPSLYPLWWYNPADASLSDWETTGSTGQNTSCLKDSKEIEVSITNSNQPALSDLGFTPFVVGLPDLVKISSFSVNLSIDQILVQWETTKESNLKGFYVVRGLSTNGTYSRTSNLIPAIGSSSIGGNYSFVDTYLNYGTTYYYKLEIIDENGVTLGFYGPAIAITATATPTVTNTPTITITPTKTLTPTITLTRTPTRTWTPYVYHTSTPYWYPTRTYTPFHTFTTTKTYFFSPTATWNAGTVLAKSFTPNLKTQLTSMLSKTLLNNTEQVLSKTLNGQSLSGNTSAATHSTFGNTSTPANGSSSQQAFFWISLVSGAVLGLLILGVAGWFLIQCHSIL